MSGHPDTDILFKPSTQPGSLNYSGAVNQLIPKLAPPIILPAELATTKLDSSLQYRERFALGAQAALKIEVKGDTPAASRARKPAVKSPLDTHLLHAELKLFCFDRTTGVPLPKVSVLVNTVANVNNGLSKNFAKAFNERANSKDKARSGKEGTCVVKLLPGHSYVITAMCPGFHKFGELGEYLLVTPKENERLEKSVGMMPIRLSICVTLRELRPLAGKDMHLDPFGQVNPLYAPPPTDKLSVQPQKVAFTTPEGMVQTFLATTLKAHDSLCVTGPLAQPAAVATLEHFAHLAKSKRAKQASLLESRLAEADALLAGAAAGVRKGMESGSGSGSELVQAAAVAAAERERLEAAMMQEPPKWLAADGGTFVYSTDGQGHCLFYGPRIDAGRMGPPVSSLVRDFNYFSGIGGPWSYHSKWHLTSNVQSPVVTVFDKYPARSRLRHLPSVHASMPDGSALAKHAESDAKAPEEQAMVTSNRNRVRPQSAGSLFTLQPPPSSPTPPLTTRYNPLGLSLDAKHSAWPASAFPSSSAIAAAGGAGEKRQQLLRFAGDSGNPRAVSPGAGSPHQGGGDRAWLARNALTPEQAARVADYASLAAAIPGVAALKDTAGEGGRGLAGKSTTVWNEGRAVVCANLAAMGVMPMDPEGVHNYLHPGNYDISVWDPSKLLIFYTYTGDKEKAVITQAQDSLVPLTMPDVDPDFMAPRVEGSPLPQVNHPVQLYCRARPWFQLCVYDMGSMEEVGSEYGLEVIIQRIDYRRSLRYRVVRMRALMASVGSRDLSDCDPEEIDAEALAWIAKQEDRGRLAGLWAKAELQEVERAAITHEEQLGQRLYTDANPGWKLDQAEMELLNDEDLLYVPIYSGPLPASQRVYITPGDKYAVTLQGSDPFVELMQRQTRIMGWELEPFVFYTVRKIRLLVGLREHFSQELPVGCKVLCKVLEAPEPRRPPVVRQEWCEGPATYAARIIDQLIDYIVQVRSSTYKASVATELEAETDADGLALFDIAPNAQVTVSVVVGADYEEQDSCSTITLTKEAEQFIGFQLERITYTHISVSHCVTGAGVEGFLLKAYDITHLVDNPPKQGTSRQKSIKKKRQEDEEMEVAKHTINVAGLAPFWSARTLANGEPETPLACRAGRVVKVVVADPPRDYLLPEFYQSGSGTAVLTTCDRHEIKFVAPPKPRVRVAAQDMCTMEYVYGVRLRVMARYIRASFVAEGERISPQQASQEAMLAAAGVKDAAERGGQSEAPRDKTQMFEESASVVHMAMMKSEQQQALDEDDGPQPQAAGGTAPPGLSAGTAQGTQAGPVAKSVGGAKSALDAKSAAGVKSVASKRSGAARGRAYEQEDEDQEELERREAELEQFHANVHEGWTLTDQNRVYWNGGAMPNQAAVPSTRPPPSPSAPAPDPDADPYINILDQVRELARTGGLPDDGMPPDVQAPLTLSAQVVRGRLARSSFEVEGWAATEATAVTRKPAVPALLPSPRSPSNANKGEGKGKGFSYAPSDNGSSVARFHGLGFIGGGGKRRGPVATIRGRGTEGGVAGSATKAAQAQTTEGEEPEVVPEAESFSEDGLRAEQDNPEELEPWGPVWYETYTGHPDVDLDGLGLIMDADMEVAVQIMPVWPFNSAPQLLTVRLDSWKDPLPSKLLLPRDDTAFRFWAERDRVLHSFYDTRGAPKIPYHSLARLQPAALPCRLVAPWHPGLQLLKPAEVVLETWREQYRAGAGDFKAAKLSWGDNIVAGGPAADSSAAGGGGVGAPGSASQSFLVMPHVLWQRPPCQLVTDLPPPEEPEPPRWINPLIVGNGGGGEDKTEEKAGPAKGKQEQGRAQGAWGTTLDLPAVDPADAAIQFEEDNPDADTVHRMAWDHLRLADSRYLPLERTRLVAFLSKWGAFPHIQGGYCKACSGPTPNASSPFLMTHYPNGEQTVQGSWDEEGAKHSRYGSAAAAAKRSGQLRSQLLGGEHGTDMLTAVWALDRPSALPRQLPPHLCKHVPDKSSRTHKIMNSAEAIYCDSPFFTWRLPNGSALHVGVHELLYRELIPLIDSTAASVEFMHRHLQKVKAHNETRGKHGRFLLGHEAVNDCKGGLFVLDVSGAMPYTGETFILDQLGDVWDYWAASTGEAADSVANAPTPRTPPWVNLAVVAGRRMELYNPDLFQLVPVQGGHASGLRSWWDEIKGTMPRTADGFRFPQVLQKVLSAAAGRVPLYLMVGGLLTHLKDGFPVVSRVLYEAQLQCIDQGIPLQPLHCIEMYPMPKVREKRRGLAGSNSCTSAAEQNSSQASSVLDDGGDEVLEGRGGRGGGLSPSPRGQQAEDGQAEELSPDIGDTSSKGADVFELLLASMGEARVRLVDVFRELDRESKGHLNGKQLGRLLTRFVPDATAAHVRYFQLMLDTDGSSGVTYKELATAFKAANRSGLTLALRDHLEVNMLLQRIALTCMMETKTVQEVFAKFDNNNDGFLDQIEQWRMIEDIFPGMLLDEKHEMFAALQVVDLNNDERISWDEFSRAFSAGGVPQLQAWGNARDPDELRRLRVDNGGGGPDDNTLAALRAEQEARVMDGVRAEGFPLTRLMSQLCGATRGRHRRLDLGHGRAFAEPVDIVPLERSMVGLQKALAQLLAFEAAYGTQLTLERSTRPGRQRAGRSGALVSVEPPSPAAVANRARLLGLVDGRTIARAQQEEDKRREEEAYAPRRNDGNGSVGGVGSSANRKVYTGSASSKAQRGRPQSARPASATKSPEDSLLSGSKASTLSRPLTADPRRRSVSNLGGEDLAVAASDTGTPREVKGGAEQEQKHQGSPENDSRLGNQGPVAQTPVNKSRPASASRSRPNSSSASHSPSLAWPQGKPLPPPSSSSKLRQSLQLNTTILAFPQTTATAPGPASNAGTMSTSRP